MNKKYKQCSNCTYATYTESLKGLTNQKGIEPKNLNAIFCLHDRNFHPKIYICNSFEDRADELK